MNKAKSFLILFIGTALLSSCISIKPVTVNKIENAKVVKMDDKGIEVEIAMRIKNPNRMGFNIYNTDLDVSLGDHSLGKAKAKQKIRVNGNSDDVHKFVIQGDFKNLKGGVASLLTLRSPTVKVKGTAKVGKWFYKKKFAFDASERISLGR